MDGSLDLSFDTDGVAGKTRLARLGQSGPLRALFPETCRMGLPLAVVTATCGGFTGGDRMRIGFEAAGGAEVMVAAQAAEKIYRSTGDETEITVDLSVGASGWLEWLPQETIIFDGARLRRHSRLRIAGDGAAIAGEILVFGRAARGERMTNGLVHDAWDVIRDGRLVWADAFHAADRRLVEALGHSVGLDGAQASAMLIHAGPEVGAHLGLAREIAAAAGPELRCGATLVNGVLVMRWLAPEAHLLRPSFETAWTALRQAARGLAPHLPGFWKH